MYKDALNRELKVKWEIGGYQNNITCCVLCVKKPKSKFFGFIKRPIWIRVFMNATTESLEEIANWSDENYKNFEIKTISKFNSEKLSRSIVQNKLNTLN